MTFDKTEIIFWDGKNGARKKFDMEFADKKDASEFAKRKINYIQYNDIKEWMHGYEGVAVKIDKITSITVSHLKGMDKPLD
jgi:hypothetical protein